MHLYSSLVCFGTVFIRIDSIFDGSGNWQLKQNNYHDSKRIHFSHLEIYVAEFCVKS